MIIVASVPFALVNLAFSAVAGAPFSYRVITCGAASGSSGSGTVMVTFAFAAVMIADALDPASASPYRSTYLLRSSLITRSEKV